MHLFRAANVSKKREHRSNRVYKSVKIRVKDTCPYLFGVNNYDLSPGKWKETLYKGALW